MCVHVHVRVHVYSCLGFSLMLLVVAACTCAFRFAFVLLFEHVVFVFKYLLNLVIHDMPADVEIKVRREEYRVSPHEAQSGVVGGGKRELCVCVCLGLCCVCVSVLSVCVCVCGATSKE